VLYQYGNFTNPPSPNFSGTEELANLMKQLEETMTPGNLTNPPSEPFKNEPNRTETIKKEEKNSQT